MNVLCKEHKCADCLNAVIFSIHTMELNVKRNGFEHDPRVPPRLRFVPANCTVASFKMANGAENSSLETVHTLKSYLD